MPQPRLISMPWDGIVPATLFGRQENMWLMEGKKNFQGYSGVPQDPQISEKLYGLGLLPC